MKNNHELSRRTLIKQLAALPLLGLPLSGPLFAGRAPNKKRAASLIPVMITPFRDDKSIDWNTFDRLTALYEAAGADGYFANCLSSEMYALTPEERLAVTKRVVKYFNGKKNVVSTGSFGDTIGEKAAFVRQVYDQGVDAVILITGHFADRQEDDDVLIANLRQLVEQTGKIPLGTYECPNPYKRVLSGKAFKYLAESGRFIYHKDTSESLSNINEKLSIARKSGLMLFNAHTASAAASIRAGAAGLSPISANFYPEILNWLCDHANNPRKKEEVDWLQKEIAETEPLISRGYNLSSKYFLKKRGLPIEVSSRAPRRPLSAEQTAVLDKVYGRFQGWCSELGIKEAKS